MAVRVGVLGPVGIGTDTRIEPLAGLPGRLLAVLAADPNRLFGPDVLMDVLWGDSLPDKAKNTLQVTVNRLRRQLEPDHPTGGWKTLVTEGSRYRLNLDHIALDANDFRQKVAEATAARRTNNHRRARELLTESLDLWRGSAFDGHSDNDLIQPEAASLEEMRLSVQEDLVDLRLDLGEHEALTVELPGLVDRSPLREHRWAQLMLALYLSGRQAEALRTFQRLQQTLGDELGIEPSLELSRLEERILLQDEALAPRGPAHLVDLPLVPTTFIRRDQDLGEVAKLLGRARMVTLTGIGGIGKTRLALAVAAEVMTEYRDGVVFVDLAELADPAHVVSHVIHTIDERGPVTVARLGNELSDLVELLRGRRTLLVLDNAEHVLKEVRRVTNAVLRRCPDVRILATSRIPIGVTGESLFAIPTLAIPPEGEAELVDLAQNQSISMFLDRANQSTLRCELSEATAPAVAAICRALGGLPLAIELAGSLLEVLPLAAIREQVESDTRFVDLAPAADRLGSRMGEAVKWTVATLDGRDRAGFEALSVFRGGWTVAAAQAVLDVVGFEKGGAAGLMARLVDRSLVRYFPDQADRYGMIEPIRQTGEEGLAASGEGAAQRAHLQHYRALMLEAHSFFEAAGVGSDDYFRQLGMEIPNLRVMLDQSIRLKDPAVLDALPALCLFWTRRGNVGEGSEWVDRVLKVFDPIAEGRPFAVLYASHIAMWSSQPDLAEERLDAFDTVARKEDSPLMLVRALHTRGNLIGWGRGLPAGAVDHFLSAAQVAKEAGIPLALASLLSAAYMLVRIGHFERATDIVPELTEFVPSMPEFAELGINQVNGLIDLYQGRLDSAVERLERSYQVGEALGLRAFAGPLLISLGWAQFGRGDAEQARETASKSFGFVHSYSGGWRIAEPQILLGAISLAEGDGDSATRWFAKAVEAATRAPEQDLVIWATAGLAASTASLGQIETAAHLASHARSAQSRHGLRFPEFVRESWEVASTERVPCSLLGVAGEHDHLLQVVKSPTWAGGKP